MAFPFWLLWRIVKFRSEGWKPLTRGKIRSHLPLLVFFAFVTASLSPDFKGAGDYRYFVFGVLHYFMIVDVFSRAGRARLAIYILGLVPAFLFARGIWAEPSVLSLTLEHRLGFPLDHANTCGYLLAMTIPLALFIVASEKGRVRGAGVISLAAQIFGLLLTYSRAAWIGWSAAMVFLGQAAGGWKKTLPVLAVAAIVLLAIPGLRDRLFTLADPMNDEPIRSRVADIEDALTVGATNLILGVGYGRGRLKEAIRKLRLGQPDEKSPIWHAHNVYADLFAGTGLLGLGAFLWLIGGAFYRLTRDVHRRSEGYGSLSLFMAASLVALAVTGLGDVPFYHHETRIMFFTLLALIDLHVARAEDEERGAFDIRTCSSQPS